MRTSLRLLIGTLMIGFTGSCTESEPLLPADLLFHNGVVFTAEPDAPLWWSGTGVSWRSAGLNSWAGIMPPAPSILRVAC